MQLVLLVPQQVGATITAQHWVQAHVIYRMLALLDGPDLSCSHNLSKVQWRFPSTSHLILLLSHARKSCLYVHGLVRSVEDRDRQVLHAICELWLRAGSNYYVRILSTLNRELLKPSMSVALHRHSNALVDILPPEADSSISLLSNAERPDVTYAVSPNVSRSQSSVLSPMPVVQ